MQICQKISVTRATVAELTYDSMKTTIKAIFDYCAKSKASSEETSDIQVEAENKYFNRGYGSHGRGRERGGCSRGEQDLVAELIISTTRTMDNHAKTDLVLMVSLQNVMPVNPYFVMLENVLATRNLLSRNILFCALPRKSNNVSLNRLYLRL